jgi:hypothetical protein
MPTAIEGRPVAFLYAPDADAAVAFYEGTLGLNPAYSPGCVNGRSLPFWEGSSAA